MIEACDNMQSVGPDRGLEPGQRLAVSEVAPNGNQSIDRHSFCRWGRGLESQTLIQMEDLTNSAARPPIIDRSRIGRAGNNRRHDRSVRHALRRAIPREAGY